MLRQAGPSCKTKSSLSPSYFSAAELSFSATADEVSEFGTLLYVELDLTAVPLFLDDLESRLLGCGLVNKMEPTLTNRGWHYKGGYG